MHSRRYDFRRNRARLAAFLVGILLALIAAGCMGSYGRLAGNAQVGQAFRSGDYQAAYRYYYAGRDTMPYAIIGIDRAYTVPSRYWIAFEPDPEKLRKMSDNMYGKMGYAPTGMDILDPDGKVIGIWFSSLNTVSVRVDAQQRTLEVLFPNPENDRNFSLGMMDDRV